jgi:hypothetical protein
MGKLRPEQSAKRMSRKPWTAKELKIVRQFYAEIPTREIAELLGRSLTMVYQAAHGMGLTKSAEYLAGADACRLRRGDNVGAAFRYKPGHAPANKGLRRPGWSPGRMRETQFKLGHMPHTWLPLWSERESKDGYLEIKFREREGRYGNWAGAHVLLWEDKHGPVPAGHALVFKDGNKAHVALTNLELISRADLMRRNTIHNLPPELVKTIILLGAVKRKVREKSEKRDHGSAQPSV